MKFLYLILVLGLHSGSCKDPCDEKLYSEKSKSTKDSLNNLVLQSKLDSAQVLSLIEKYFNKKHSRPSKDLKLQQMNFLIIQKISQNSQALNNDQVLYIQAMQMFLTTNPKPEQFIEWQVKNPLPSPQ